MTCNRIVRALKSNTLREGRGPVLHFSFTSCAQLLANSRRQLFPGAAQLLSRSDLVLQEVAENRWRSP